jgi:hypothetical protein
MCQAVSLLLSLLPCDVCLSGVAAGICGGGACICGGAAGICGGGVCICGGVACICGGGSSGSTNVESSESSLLTLTGLDSVPGSSSSMQIGLSCDPPTCSAIPY